MELILYVIVLAFLFEMMDSSAGMGFGNGLTPLPTAIRFVAHATGRRQGPESEQNPLCPL